MSIICMSSILEKIDDSVLKEIKVCIPNQGTLSLMETHDQSACCLEWRQLNGSCRRQLITLHRSTDRTMTPCELVMVKHSVSGELGVLCIIRTTRSGFSDRHLVSFYSIKDWKCMYYSDCEKQPTIEKSNTGLFITIDSRYLAISSSSITDRPGFAICYSMA